MEDVVNTAPAPESELVGLLRDHFKSDPLKLPVVAQSFQMVEHANVQVALEAYIAEPGRGAELVGLAGQQMRTMGLGLSDLLARSRSAAAVRYGPVDYTAVPVGATETKSCIYLGIALITDEKRPLAVLIRAGADYRPNTQLTVEVMATSSEEAAAFHRDLKGLM